MKKFLVIAAAVAATVACTKSSLVYEDTNQIELTPVAGQITKGFGAMTSTPGYNAGESFKVWAEWVEAASSSAWDVASAKRAHYIKGDEFAKSGDTWTSSTAYYWPKTGSLLFAAVSPNTLPAGKATLNYSLTAPYTRTLKVTDFQQGTYNNAVAQSNQVDLMWVDIPATTATKAASHPMTFKHALSWLTFKASTDTDDIYTITGLTIQKKVGAACGINNKGTFTSDGARASWTNASTGVNADYDLYIDSETGKTLKASAASVIADNLLLIPQTIAESQLELVIKFKQAALDAEQTITVDFPAVTWDMQKHYIYTLKFNTKGGGGDEGGETGGDDLLITITPSVDDWATPTVDTDITAK